MAEMKVHVSFNFHPRVYTCNPSMTESDIEDGLNDKLQEIVYDYCNEKGILSDWQSPGCPKKYYK